MKNLQLSIIVPVYNTAEYLVQCIESILSQEYENFELILVDDGSTDNSLVICERYQNRDARIKIIHKENGGLISAKKAGLKVAEGQYVGFVDSDDWIDPNMYSCLMKAALVNNVDVAIGDNVIEYPDYTSKVKQGILPGLYQEKDLVDYIYPNLIFKENDYELGISPSLCTKVFKRDLIVKYQNKVNETIKAGEDAACTYPCLLEAKSIVYIENCYSYHYRIHAASMTHKKVQMEVNEKIILLNHLYSSFSNYEYPCLIRQLYLYSANMLHGYVTNCYENRVSQKELLCNIRKIQNSNIWGILSEDIEVRCIPKSIVQTLKYLKNPNVFRYFEMRFCAGFLCKKQAIRKYLSLIKQKLLKG